MKTERNTEDFKSTVRRARELKGWSVAHAARVCGYSPPMWRNFESGKAVPTIERLQDICDALDLDPLRAFRLWINRKLDEGALRKMLTKLDPQPGTWPGLAQASDAAKELARAVGQFPMDEATVDLAYRLISLVARYRMGLTRPEREPMALRVWTVPDDLSDALWTPFEDKELTTQHVVGTNMRGLGYIATVIRLEPGAGAFHQHLNEFDSGTEFFSVIGGTGVGVFEHPTSQRKRWRVFDLRPGTVGLYPGHCGHTFVNTGRPPLLVHVVCVPFPPPMMRADGRRSSRFQGYAEGIEFKCAAVHKTSLPPELREIVTRACKLSDAPQRRHVERPETGRAPAG